MDAVAPQVVRAAIPGLGSGARQVEPRAGGTGAEGVPRRLVVPGHVPHLGICDQRVGYGGVVPHEAFDVPAVLAEVISDADEATCSVPEEKLVRVDGGHRGVLHRADDPAPVLLHEAQPATAPLLGPVQAKLAFRGPGIAIPVVVDPDGVAQLVRDHRGLIALSGGSLRSCGIVKYSVFRQAQDDVHPVGILGRSGESGVFDGFRHSGVRILALTKTEAVLVHDMPVEAVVEVGVAEKLDEGDAGRGVGDDGKS